MGRGRNRRPRKFATFRLCQRPGAAFDASDCVFVRVDRNSYKCPGFADDDYARGNGAPSYNYDEGGEEEDLYSSPEGPLPEHVRREIVELGLPDDGYNYLRHLREFRPNFAPFPFPSASRRRRRALAALPADVKAYHATRLLAPFYEVAQEEAPDSAVMGTEEAANMDVVKLLDEMEETINMDVAKLLEDSDMPVAIDMDIAKLFEDSDLPGAIDLDVAKQLEDSDAPEAEAGSEDGDLEDDFVMVASLPEEEEQIIFVIDDGDDQFVLVALDNEYSNIDSEDSSGVTRDLFNCEAQKA